MSSPPLPRRVVITGIGIITSLGRGREQTRNALLDARSGIRRIENFDSSKVDCKIAGEIPADMVKDAPHGFDRFTKLALLAAAEAAEQARYADIVVAPERVATILGTGLGGCETLDAGYERLYARGQTRMPPTIIPYSMYNAPTSAISSRYGARGPAYSIVSACASASHAIGQAAEWVRNGRVEIAITGGTDAPLTVGTIRAWEGLRVLAVDNEHPERACRPFSADRRGLVLAEGAAVFILESLDHAHRRGQKALGEIAGFGMSSDAGHLTDPSLEGNARAMSLALEDAQLKPEEVDYVNAHGTGTRANDSTETAAIHKALGGWAERIPVSSTKSAHGHTMGASGAVELAVSLLTLNEGVIPATLNYENPDPDCDLDYVGNEPRRGLVRNFLSNSFGFGGMNAVIAARTAHAIQA